VLAVGLGIGAVVAATAGTAAADPAGTAAADPVLPLDPNVAASFDGAAGTLGTAAADPVSPLDPPDLAISFSGVPLLELGTASATSGFGDLAIAIGPNADAKAIGFGDFASAISTGSESCLECAIAVAGDPIQGVSGNDFDFASAFGKLVDAGAGNPFNADPNTSSFDFASAVGGGGTPPTGSEAFAGLNGNFDNASVVGQNVFATAGQDACPALVCPVPPITPAPPGNFDSATVLGNLFTAPSSEDEASAGGAAGLTGSNDTAFVVDPFATTGGTAADAGAEPGVASGSYDLAGALAEGLHAVATGGNFLVDILP
jgi:hypothetical protein